MGRRINGVIAAVPTAFDISGEPDIDMFMAHSEWVLGEGCDGLNVLGSTGEANSQSRSSRETLMRSVAESRLRDAALMVGTGTPSLDETIALTSLAAKLRFDAALILPPYYYKPVSDDGLFRFFEAVINAVKDQEIGIYLYNFPQMTGISFSTELVERLLEKFPRHMRGMKDSSGDMDYTKHIAATFSETFDVFPGSEAPLADAKEFGYTGCISASVNATAARAVKVWRERDAVTEQEISELRELRAEIASVPIVAAVKALVAIRTGRSEWRRMLPPLVELSGADQRAIEAIAVQLGFSHTSAEAV